MIIVASHFGDVTIVNKVWSMHMSRFSVKKPMTVFVAVIIVIALGIVSLIKMTRNAGGGGTDGQQTARAESGDG